MSLFCIWVNVGGRAHGYLRGDGTVCAWQQDARRFTTVEAATAYIAERGWKDDMAVRPGVTTAYVCEASR